MDKRELLLARLLTILAAVTVAPPAVLTVFRNRGEVPTAKRRPAIVMLDGRETASAMAKQGRVRTNMGAQLITLEPQVFLLLQPRDTTANEGIGEEMSLMRSKIIPAVLGDSELLRLCGDNGEVAYRGCDTDMQTGSTMQGEMQFNFALVYVLNPNDL